LNDSESTACSPLQKEAQIARNHAMAHKLQKIMQMQVFCTFPHFSNELHATHAIFAVFAVQSSA
ncbi:MAG: hypothetical protein NXI25_26145, partial [bacterium]|nr:hypothetical protein [bacterium]